MMTKKQECESRNVAENVSGSGEPRGRSRQAEEEYLQETLAVVRDNVSRYGSEVAALREGIDDMQAHFHDDNPELINELENAYTMYDFLSNTLARNERALKKPYFGRIDFHDQGQETDETYYIGRSGVFRDVIHPMVIDWRAPIANVYYENGLGECSYLSADGEKIEINLELKRTYEIENGKLQNIFDTETVANDDLLTKYLSKNKQAVLGEIVATIQKEQNEIIRKTPFGNCLVQGVAGSGKTTVAMHRISYILYNYEKQFRPEDFYIVGSNQILLNYITGVLPDLDVYGVRQMTMEQLFVRLLYEDWDGKKYRIKGTDTKNPGNVAKGGLSWFRDLEGFCARLERSVISRDSVYLNPRQFVEGFFDGKTGVFDRTGGEPADPKQLVRLIDGSGLDDYLLQYPTLSIQSKINLLNQLLQSRIRDEFSGKGVKYTEAERKAIVRAYRGKYGPAIWKKSIYSIYRDFLDEQAAKGLQVDIPDKAFDVYDLAALAYLYKRVKETEEISEAHHVVIDEAQDFGMMVYSALKFCMKDCTYTIMGDTSQNIRFGYGLSDWEELRKLYLTDSRSSFCVLKKSYRNTVEISGFATGILRHGQFAVYPVEPIIRHGDCPSVCRVENRRAMTEKAAGVCGAWRQAGFETIAVICRTADAARETARELGQLIDVVELDPENATFGSGIMVLPVEYTKGLEFDAVLIFDPTREDYPSDDGHVRLLYVAATRALHELCVLHTGNLTGLIADPVPEKVLRLQPETEPQKQPEAELRSNAESEKAAGVRTREAAEPKTQKAAGVRKRETAESKPQKAAGEASEIETESKLQRATEPQKMTGQRPAAKSGAGWEASEEEEKLALLMAKRKVAVQRDVRKPEAPRDRAAKPEKVFGSMPETELLRAPGHARTDQSVRWVTARPEGLYLQSAYGILRLSPVSGKVIRITFAQDRSLLDAAPSTAPAGTTAGWKYRESPRLLEVRTTHLCLQIEKKTGSIYYMTGDKTPLLAERGAESRLFEKTPQGERRARLYLDWPKNENLFALGEGRMTELPLKGVARYISHQNSARLPVVLSDRGYALAVAASGPVLCCGIANYGTHLLMENTEVIDYYFMAAGEKEELLSIYGNLCKIV